MATLHDRYQNGDREQVWADLCSLGPRIRDLDYFPDAHAVAQETMRRARHNVESLIVKLEKLGYRFLTQHQSAGESLSNLRSALSLIQTADRVSAASRPNPHVDKMREHNRSLIENPIFQGLMSRMESKAAEPEPVGALKNPDIFSPAGKNAAKEVREFEASFGGPIPLSLRAWYEVVGSVSLIGSHEVLAFRDAQSGAPAMYVSPALIHGAEGQARLERLRSIGMNVATDVPVAADLPLADPLVVRPELEADADYACVVVAPDELQKAGISGDAYCMDVPDASADAIFQDWHRVNFVDYLRIAFRWGGFPGWERYPQRPQKELDYLADGLLEI